MDDHIAHVEDAPDNDTGSSVEGIHGTRKYAKFDTPVKERPNTGKSRSEKRPAVSRSGSSAGAGLTDSDSTALSSEKKSKDAQAVDHESQREKYREQRRRERRAREDEEDRRAKEAAAKERESRTPKKTRPPAPKHSATQPVVQQAAYLRGRVDDPSCFGVKQPAVSGSRPRAQTRPASYSAGQPAGHDMVSPAWQPSQFSVGSFPGPSTMWSGAGPSPAGYGPPPPSPGGRAPGLYDPPQSHLRQRFENQASAMPLPQYLQEELPNTLAPRVSRRSSQRKRLDEDARRMPPPKQIPQRPQSALPPATMFRPPPSHPPRQNQSRPPPSHRRAIGFEEPTYNRRGYDDDLENGGLFNDLSPNVPHEQRRKASARQRRGSVAYERPEYDLVPASGRTRRSSVYGGLSGGGVNLGMERKMGAALEYQNQVSGGPRMPLTAEMLREAMKQGGVPSSRSTRSSGSRDESEYRRSSTTGNTHFSSGNDQITIKVPGNAVVRLPGAEIECSKEGGEITYSSRPSGSRAGSDRASTIYQQFDDSRRIEDGRRSEDSRRRMSKALPMRPRAPSQADSQSRGYGPAHAPYDSYGSFI